MCNILNLMSRSNGESVESSLWDNILSAIKSKLQGESFETWFNPIRFEGVDRVQRLIRLRAPNPARPTRSLADDHSKARAFD